MSEEVVLLRINNLEITSERHERLIEQLVESQIDMKTGLAKVATESGPSRVAAGASESPRVPRYV